MGTARRTWAGLAAAAAGVLGIGAFGSVSNAGSADPIEVGIIYSETGPLASYGLQYRQGFEAGLDYATGGTGAVDGRTIDVQWLDDGGDPESAVNHAKDLIGEGVTILGGSTSSGVALAVAEQADQNQVLFISGPAATDAITGINHYTFRSGRQSLQDVATAASFIDTEGADVLVFAQDNAFGQSNVAAVEGVFGAAGATVSSLLVPEDATEFTPFGAQINDAVPDLVFVAWAGATTPAMWQALDQQGVLESTTVVTGLADSATFGAYGAAATGVDFLSHYFPAAVDNDVNTAMIDAVTAAGGTPDLFTPDGFVAAQMIVQAVTEGDPGDVDSMIAALEGWTFDAPKGSQTIRAEDHAMIQPMFQAHLSEADGTWTAELVNEVPADDVAPPAPE